MVADVIKACTALGSSIQADYWNQRPSTWESEPEDPCWYATMTTKTINDCLWAQL